MPWLISAPGVCPSTRSPPWLMTSWSVAGKVGLREAYDAQVTRLVGPQSAARPRCPHRLRWLPPAPSRAPLAARGPAPRPPPTTTPVPYLNPPPRTVAFNAPSATANLAGQNYTINVTKPGGQIASAAIVHVVSGVADTQAPVARQQILRSRLMK